MRFVNYEIVIIEELMDKGIKLDINVLFIILFGYKCLLELNELELISGSEEEIWVFENVVLVCKLFIYDFF